MALPRYATQDLQLVQGDSLTLNLTMLDEDNDPKDLTGMTFLFRIGTRNNENVVEYSLLDHISVVSAAAGTFKVDIQSSDTDGLVPGQTYTYQVQATDSGSKVKTVIKGFLKVENSLFY